MKKMKFVAAALFLAALSANPAPASAKGLAVYYDTEPRGTFFCGGPPTTWSKLPIVGSVGRLVSGKGYVAGVTMRRVPKSANYKSAAVRFNVRVDGGMRLPERESQVEDLSLGNARWTRNFRVSILEKEAVQIGSGSRFGPDGEVKFRDLAPGSIWAASTSIRNTCATPEDFGDGDTQDQLSEDLSFLLRLIGTRSRGRIFRAN